MKKKIYEAYINKDIKKYNKIISKISKLYHEGDCFRILDLCSDFGISCAIQNLDGNANSYAAFNVSFNNTFHNDKFIVVERNISFKEKRMHYAYHFFQYVLNNKENYEVTYNSYKNRDCYNKALELLLPEKRVLKDYKMLLRSYSNNSVALYELSNKYLVPYDNVSRRIENLLNKDNKTIKII